MEAAEFERRVREDPAARALLEGVAQEAGRHVKIETPERMITVTGVDLLFSLAAYALYRFTKDFFDHRRALHETAVAGQQERLIAALIQDGFPPDQAQAVATALLKGIRERAADDPALKSVQALIGSGK